MEEEIWIRNILYNTNYIIMAATLFRHHGFVIFHEKELKTIGQKGNL